MWTELNYLRGLFLVAQSNLRKSIILPSIIIAKNIGHILLFQGSKFPKDWEQMRREVHIKCAPDGTEYSETEFPDKWKRNGMQIKFLFPFRLKPWHSHSPELPFEKKMRWSYLTTLGFETDIPFGDPIPQLGPFFVIFSTYLQRIDLQKIEERVDHLSKIEKRIDSFQKIEETIDGIYRNKMRSMS
jgi:hypothetical protein